MKISRLKTVVVNAEMRNWVFVKVGTDVPGLYGWGEASLEWKTRSVVGAVEDFEPMIVGEDPTRIRASVSKDVPAILLAHRGHRAIGHIGH
jgi:galactonate dehydratase